MVVNHQLVVNIGVALGVVPLDSHEDGNKDYHFLQTRWW